MRETGNRLRQRLVDTVTGDSVESWNKARGYEVGEDSFLVVEDHDLETAQQQARAMRPGAVMVQPASPTKWRGAPAPKSARASIQETSRSAPNPNKQLTNE
jgi:hypothetical protein